MERLDVEDRCDGMDIGPNAVFETRSMIHLCIHGCRIIVHFSCCFKPLRSLVVLNVGLL